TTEPTTYKRKKPSTLCRRLLMWCQLESNQRHKDFQSFALPTELWHPSVKNKRFCFVWECKCSFFFQIRKLFRRKNHFNLTLLLLYIDNELFELKIFFHLFFIPTGFSLIFVV